MKYEFAESESYKTRVPIVIKEDGDYNGIKFVYGTIKFVEVGEDENNMGLNFTYEILENPNKIEEDQNLIDIIGDVLVDVLESEMGQLGEGEFLSQE